MVWLWARSRTAALEARFRLLAGQLAQRESELTALRADRDTLKTQVARLETELTAERNALQQAQARLTDTFKALAADALTSSNTQFLELARETFAKLHSQSTDDLGKRQQAIDALVKPLKESLEKVDAKIADLEQKRAQAYGDLNRHLESLRTAQAQLQSETSRLSTALRSTTAAGRWGEIQLRRVVELAGMVEHCDFVEQETVGTEDRRLRPDLIVRLPGGGMIAVDAKAPLQAYLDATTATDDAVRAAKLTEHGRQVRAHIDALAGKAYWAQFEHAPQVVVLFLPGEAFYYGAFQADPALAEYGFERNVLLATPVSLIALLRAASYGWRQEKLSENAAQIAELGRELSDRIATYLEHFEDIGRSLGAATKSYNAAVGSLEGKVLPGARKFAELGARGAKELPDIRPVEIAPRDITKRA